MSVKDTEPASKRIAIFKAYGIELEYMIVDRDTLNVLPVTDKVMHAVAGAYEDEVERGEISWSNELALHVLEFKTSRPMPSLDDLHTLFQEHVKEVNQLLKRFNGKLMPTAMHPWMDPHKEMHLWPHAHNPIYESYNRIFDCRGHGWSNLQSTHINLPFSNDAEFAKLHAAIRVLLPVMSALSASSPIIDKKASGMLDTRLSVYLNNSRIIPSITGKVIPEVCLSREEYETNILQRIYRDIAPHDPEKILQYEWLNSRGAIARFDRYTIEIRVLDVQECPQADLAIANLIIATVKALTKEKWGTIEQMNSIPTDVLYHIFLDCLKGGETTLLKYPEYLALFGISHEKTYTANDLWKHLAKHVIDSKDKNATALHGALEVILEQGPLARRILKKWNKDPSMNNLKTIYGQLCACLDQGEMFTV